MSEKILNHGNQKTTPQSGVEVIGSAQENIKNQTQKALEIKELGSEFRLERRVYFVRHGESVEDEKNRDQEKKSAQSPKTELSETGKTQIQNTAKILKEMGLKKEDTLFIYADDTTRVTESLEIFLGAFPDVKTINDHRLKTSPKDIDGETGEVKGFTGTKRLLNDLGVSIDTIALMDDILEQDMYKKYKHIVLVGHKSNKAGVEESVENTNRGFQGDTSIKNGEIIEADIAEDRQYLNYKEKRVLQVTSKSYQKLKEIFPEIEAKNVINFQNELNKVFFLNTELYKKYVYSEVKDLRVFCVLNLIKNKDIQTLNAFFRTHKIEIPNDLVLSKEEKNILYYYQVVYPQVLETRNKSLDKRIKDGENIEPYFNFDNKTYSEVFPLITEGKPIKYIEGKAGAGKSYLLSYIAEKLNEENFINTQLLKPYYLVYINLSGEIPEVTNEIYSGYEVVYLLDSIDEGNITGEERKKLDQKLLDLSKKARVIITSRSGYLEKYDENKKQEKDKKDALDRSQEIIEIQDFSKEQIDDYLEKYFGKDISNIAKTKDILKKLNGAGNNPLILLMICEVVRNNQEIDIENIKIIDLYEKISRLRLVDFNVGKNKERKINKESFLKSIFQGLEKIGYIQLVDGENILSIDDYISVQNEEAIEGINLLFRKNEDGEYDFVHQSFKEYFAARYIFEEMKKNPKFDYEDFLCQKLKNVDINFLEMLVDFLKTDEKVKEKFLKQIDENESYFPPSTHYKIVYLLGKLDEKKQLERKKWTIPKHNKNSIFQPKEINDTNEKYIYTKFNVISLLNKINLDYLNKRNYSNYKDIISEVFEHIFTSDNIGVITQHDYLDNYTIIKAMVSLIKYQKGYSDYIEKSLLKLDISMFELLLPIIFKYASIEYQEHLKLNIENYPNNIKKVFVKILGEKGDIDFVRSQINDNNKEIFPEIINALTIIGNTDDLEFIKTQFESKDFFIKFYAMLALLKQSDGRILYLRENISDEYLKYIWKNILPMNNNFEVALDALVLIGGNNIQRFILNRIKGVKRWRLDIIENLYKNGKTEYIEVIKDTMMNISDIRLGLILTLMENNDISDMVFIRQQAAKCDELIEEHIVTLLTLSGQLEDIEILLMLFKKGNSSCIREISKSFLKLGGGKIVKAIQSEINTKSIYTFKEVVFILSQFGGRENIQILINKLSTSSDEEKRMIIFALMNIGLHNYPEIAEKYKNEVHICNTLDSIDEYFPDTEYPIIE